MALIVLKIKYILGVLALACLMIAGPVNAQNEKPSESCQKIITTQPWMRAQLKEGLVTEFDKGTAEAMMAWYEAYGSLQMSYSTRVSEVEEEQKTYTNGVAQCIEELMPTCDETLASFEESGVPANYAEQVDSERYKTQSCIFDVEESVKGE